MKATGIRLKASCSNPDSLSLRKLIPFMWRVALIRDSLKKKLYMIICRNTQTIQVNIRPTQFDPATEQEQ